MESGQQLYAGGLKFVRWAYTARNRGELTVQRGTEVEIMRVGSKDIMYRVKLDDGKVGLIPEKCFYPRKKVNFTYVPDYDGEIPVNKGDVIGIIENYVGGSNMCKIMKDGGVEGNIPQYCLYRHFEVYADHMRENQDELSVKRGETVGLVEDDSFDVYWKVYYKGKTGRVPSKCFEPPAQVHWDHEAKTDDDISIKKGDTVTLVDHHRNVEGKLRVKVRLDDKVGYIPRKCFEIPATVYWDNDGESNSGLFVKKGDIVGLIEMSADERPPEGYLKARLGAQIGMIPKKCFEVPAKVVRDYKKAKPNELTVHEGQEVRVMDATAYIRVRYGNAQGEVPFSCINTDVQEIFRLLEKRKDEDDSHHSMNEDENAQNPSKGQIGDTLNANVDESALCAHLEMSNIEEVVYYLKDIEPDKVGEIGLKLGLGFGTLHALNSGSLREEMASAWLQRKDQVEKKTGIPSWKSLGMALQKLGLADAAAKISKDNTRLEMAKVIKFRWNAGSQTEELKIVDQASTKWSRIGHFIGMSEASLEAIEMDRSNTVQRFEDVMRYWMQNGGTNEYPATWLGLRRVLIDSEMSVLSDKVKNAMDSM